MEESSSSSEEEVEEEDERQPARPTRRAAKMAGKAIRQQTGGGKRRKQPKRAAAPGALPACQSCLPSLKGQGGCRGILSDGLHHGVAAAVKGTGRGHGWQSDPPAAVQHAPLVAVPTVLSLSPCLLPCLPRCPMPALACSQAAQRDRRRGVRGRGQGGGGAERQRQRLWI